MGDVNSYAYLLAAGVAAGTTGDLDENKVTPGVLGFIVFAVMGIAVWFLMKSMNRHMNRVDFEVPPDAPDAAPGPTEGAAPAPSGAGPGK
jgi:hypothetical protein